MGHTKSPFKSHPDNLDQTTYLRKDSTSLPEPLTNHCPTMFPLPYAEPYPDHAPGDWSRLLQGRAKKEVTRQT
jgi:hypothetical protein